MPSSELYIIHDVIDYAQRCVGRLCVTIWVIIVRVCCWRSTGMKKYSDWFGPYIFPCVCACRVDGGVAHHFDRALFLKAKCFPTSLRKARPARNNLRNRRPILTPPSVRVSSTQQGRVDQCPSPTLPQTLSAWKWENHDSGRVVSLHFYFPFRALIHIITVIAAFCGRFNITALLYLNVVCQLPPLLINTNSRIEVFVTAVIACVR